MHDLRSNWRMPRKRHGAAAKSGAKRRSDQAIGGRNGEVPRTAGGNFASMDAIAASAPNQVKLRDRADSAKHDETHVAMLQPHEQHFPCPSPHPSWSQSASSSEAATIETPEAIRWPAMVADSVVGGDCRAASSAHALAVVEATRQRNNSSTRRTIDMDFIMGITLADNNLTAWMPAAGQHCNANAQHRLSVWAQGKAASLAIDEPRISPTEAVECRKETGGNFARKRGFFWKTCKSAKSRPRPQTNQFPDRATF